MNKKEIEGTPERAADRGRAEDLGYVVSSQPSLGDPSVVRALVSEFAAGVVSVRGKWLSGREADPLARVRELAREYGDIVMGRDSRYGALAWHNPSRLGQQIALVTPAEPGVTDPGELLFVTVGTSLVEIAAAHEAGRLPDSDAERHTRALLEDTAALIVGVR